MFPYTICFCLLLIFIIVCSKYFMVNCMFLLINNIFCYFHNEDELYRQSIYSLMLIDNTQLQ